MSGLRVLSSPAVGSLPAAPSKGHRGANFWSRKQKILHRHQAGASREEGGGKPEGKFYLSSSLAASECMNYPALAARRLGSNLHVGSSGFEAGQSGDAVRARRGGVKHPSWRASRLLGPNLILIPPFLEVVVGK